MIENTLIPPYYAVVFTTKLTNDLDGYNEMAIKMKELAKQQEGYLGIETARSEIGITVSYWRNLDSISKWKNNALHIEAREKGRKQWYDQYQLRICKVEREYEFKK